MGDRLEIGPGQGTVMGEGWEQGCQPSPLPGNLPRRLFCSAMGEREGESCSGGWVPPTQNPPSPLRCPTGCCRRGGVWPDPAARAGCAVPLGTKVQRVRWHSPVSWFKPRQPVTPRPCAAWHLQGRAATCPGTHGRRWVRPSVCRGERLAPNEKEPAGSFAAAQQQAEPFAAGRQEPRVLPALCLHPGVPACCAPSASPGWLPLARNDLRRVEKQARPCGCSAEASGRVGFWDTHDEDEDGESGSTHGCLHVLVSCGCRAGGEGKRGAARLSVLPFRPTETLSKPAGVGIFGRGTSRLPPGEHGDAIPGGSGGSAAAWGFVTRTKEDGCHRVFARDLPD